MHRVITVVTGRAVDVRAPVVHENIAKTTRSIASVRRRMCDDECGDGWFDENCDCIEILFVEKCEKCALELIIANGPFFVCSLECKNINHLGGKDGLGELFDARAVAKNFYA